MYHGLISLVSVLGVLGICGCASGGGESDGRETGSGLSEVSASAAPTTSEGATSAGTTGSSAASTSETGAMNETGSMTETGTETDTGDPPSLGARVVIYQLVVRHFGNTNQTRAVNGTLAQNGVGRFADVDEAAIAGLVDLGVTYVWLAGVLRQATLTDYSALGMPADDPDIVKGLAGSFYAIRDYFDVCPDYAVEPAARLAEFDATVARLHAAGLRVLIDLVPNHVARSYASVVRPELDFGAEDDQGALFRRDNNYFYLVGQGLGLTRPGHYNPAGADFDGAFEPEDGGPGRTAKVTGNNQMSATPSANDWYETIKLNWGYDFTTDSAEYVPIPDTWLKMDEIVAYWQSRGVDGFRADFAHFVPNEGWQWLISRAQARDPEVFFVAEAYEDLEGLLAAGFDSVYFDEAYDDLKRIYQGKLSQSGYAARMGALSEAQRPKYLQYLENHDERRIASPVVVDGGADDSGFGAKEAGYKLAPLSYLYSSGPILIYNGQEVGEPGAGVEGFGQEDGRTSIFDYWSLSELSKWVNGGAHDGGLLAPDQAALRGFYKDLLALSQDESVMGSGYWGLDYFNNPQNFPDCPAGFYSFARFVPGSGRVLVVVANFTLGGAASGPLRLPAELLAQAELGGAVTVRRVLDEGGSVDQVVSQGPAESLMSAGFVVSLPDQRAQVFVVEEL